MKFSCPECQAKYQVELPSVGDAGVEVKCARCTHTFRVFEEAPSAVAAGTASEEGASDALPDTLSNESAESADPFDAFMDDLVEQEITDNLPSDEPEQTTPADTSLDGLLDDLLTEDTPDASSSSGLDDQALDQIWEDSVDEGQQEELAAPEPLASEPVIPDEEATLKEDVPEEKTPAINETQETPAAEETESLQEEQSPAPEEEPEEAELSQDELWNEAFADQAAEESKQSEPAETAEVSDDSDAGDMDNMSEDDAWAAAFADQASTETKQESGDSETAEASTDSDTGDMENASEEDAWAAAFADQDATETKQETSNGETAEATEATDDAGDMDNMSEDDAWAAAFADQEATETKQESGDSETTEADAAEATDGAEESEEDLWAKAFEDQAQVEDAQSDTEKDAPAEAPADSSEEDLWEQAFDETGGGESPASTSEPTADDGGDSAEATGEKAIGTEASDEEMEKLAAMAHDEDAGPSLADEAMANYNEDDYADFDDDEFETDSPKKKFAFLSLLQGKTGKLVLGGGVLALLLIGGSIYFAIQTFAPPELVEEGQMAQVDAKNEAAEETSDENAETEGENGEAGVEDGPSAVEEAQNALLNDEEPASAPEEKEPVTSNALNSALQPFADIVEMSTILPVAYSATDIKVLSFTIHFEMDAQKTAENVRDALPVYEKIMVTTVENFLKRKFYNDILYVKEKLVKRLERAINKGLKQGKIKKTKFKDFQIS